MTTSLRAFLRGLIDYAGLFPPADLDLDSAMTKYARYREVSDAWMLGRFIIPVDRLSELEPYSGLFGEGEPFRFSVLGHPALKMNIFDAAQKSVADAQVFESHHEGRVIADRFEFKWQPKVLELPVMEDLLGQVRLASDEKLSMPTRAFIEVPLMGERWEAGVEKTIRAIADANAEAGKDVFGLKLRCGGVTSDAFPEIEAVAFALLFCHDAEIPFKATAGLHHPVRHFSKDVDAMMHGFLNFFGGAILASLHQFDSSTLQRMLADEHAEHFAFSDEAFRWTDWSASVDDITALRDRFATSFGSCSFDEPREDLVELGLMESASSSA